MKHIKLFEAFNESHTDRTAIDDLGNESEVKDAVMSALEREFPVVGDFTKEVRNLLGGIMFSHENKSVETNNECLEDIAELLKADVHEVAFTIGEAIWKLDPAIVENSTEQGPTAADRSIRITPDNIDTLTFKAYINRSSTIVDTLENINKYAIKNNLTWMWWYDNGYSVASESPSTYEKVRKGILDYSHGRTIYLSSNGKGFSHNTNS